MDKFDDMIQKSSPDYQPSSSFVDETMAKIEQAYKPKRSRLRIWAPALVCTLAVVALVFIVAPLLHGHSPSNGGTNTKSASDGSANVATALPAGADNASLEQDLSSIQASQNQENTDQQGATATLNDSAQEIAIPTN